MTGPGDLRDPGAQPWLKLQSFEAWQCRRVESFKIPETLGHFGLMNGKLRLPLNAPGPNFAASSMRSFQVIADLATYRIQWPLPCLLMCIFGGGVSFHHPLQ